MAGETLSFPRVYLLRASEAPRALAFITHRQKCWSLHLWDLDAHHVEPGAMFFGTLYPRRCALSPDGRYLLYFAMKAPGDPDWPHQFSGLSRAPWLTCLLAWREAGTWTRGMFFSSRASGRPEIHARQDLHHGADVADLCPWNIERIDAMQLAAERRIGFVEAEDSPPRDPRDIWDQHRQAVLQKRRPVGGAREVLRVVQGGFDQDEGRVGRYRNHYGLVGNDGREIPLSNHVWLDWLDRDHLYGATLDGRLVVCALRRGELVETWSHEFERMPRRKPAPPFARHF
ncbi:hypothetical protein [Polyangium jinanense]|uniref:Uncharacterized protein n=1 Tax=Polyangium jinanense TaxID=2829994 RepID=A0A9X3XC42_9BACT|nr:hypothetical protein [Polyangium jinanense]MDC3959591.1 hypothetical protein [Polyangium jinanense]MDC3986560.1 hypothetical protein [Polyangium jinanense]